LGGGFGGASGRFAFGEEGGLKISPSLPSDGDVTPSSISEGEGEERGVTPSFFSSSIRFLLSEEL
jgi:hypothetical protein